MASAIIIDPCVELHSSYDPGERWRSYGRLILSDEALYFIHGWDERGRPAVWGLLNPVVKLHASDVIGPDGEQDRGGHVGEQLLADVADRSPAEQAMIVPRSRALPLAELSTATLGRFWSRVVVETRRQGEALGYRVPRRLRADVADWIERAGLASSSAALKRV